MKMKNKTIEFSSMIGEPVKFNSQFHKVKVYIAYAGKNRNGSYISKETFEKMIPSLYGVPIVAEWKDDDFGSHGGKVEISEDGVEYIDTTVPYGFVDSDAVVEWENITEEDGTEREYLTTTAFLWTGRYPKALKVLENQNNHSMEINVHDGSFAVIDSEEYFKITDGEFSALCILGSEVEPCFQGSKVVEFNLEKDKFKLEFAEMVTELKQSLKNGEFEGGGKVKDNEKNVDEVEEVAEDFDSEETTPETQVDVTVVSNEVDATEETEETEGVCEENFTKTFELSHDDIRSKIYKNLYEVEDEDDTWYYIVKVFDTHFVYSNEQVFYKQSYVKTDKDIAFEGDRIEMFVEFLTGEEVKALDLSRSQYSMLEEEVVSLREFKETKDKEAYELEQAEIREGKVEYINENYSNLKDDVKDLFIGRVDEYASFEDIDADICVYIVKNKLSFSKTTKEVKTAKFNVVKDNTSKIISPYGDIFNK